MFKVQKEINPVIAFLSLALLTFWIKDFLSSVTICFLQFVATKTISADLVKCPWSWKSLTCVNIVLLISDFAYNWMNLFKKKSTYALSFLPFLLTSYRLQLPWSGKRWQGYKVRREATDLFYCLLHPSKTESTAKWTHGKIHRMWLAPQRDEL